MNTRAKGNKARREVVQWFKDNGGDAAICERTGKFIKEKDLFGLFDVVAYDKNHDVYFIQITCNKPHTHKPFLAFAKLELPINTVQFVRMDGGKWKVFAYHASGRKALWTGDLDER